jgi:hypothetical protein
MESLHVARPESLCGLCPLGRAAIANVKRFQIFSAVSRAIFSLIKKPPACLAGGFLALTFSRLQAMLSWKEKSPKGASHENS